MTAFLCATRNYAGTKAGTIFSSHFVGHQPMKRYRPLRSRLQVTSETHRRNVGNRRSLKGKKTLYGSPVPGLRSVPLGRV